MKTVRLTIVLTSAIALIGPALLVFPLSVSSSRFMDISGLSLRWFASAMSPFWLNAVLLSVGLAIAAATLASLAAIPAAYFVSVRGRTIATALLDLAAVGTLL